MLDAADVVREMMAVPPTAQRQNGPHRCEGARRNRDALHNGEPGAAGASRLGRHDDDVRLR
jgi:hypothetical protein